MDDAVHALLVLSGAAFSLMVCGAALTFGIASVCRGMKLAPINTTITINHYGESEHPAFTPANPTEDVKDDTHG